jgi:uroporphyrin-III C-methyltransferase/precorrin-2 dehydrogenase/sirohydrochlorin ferrochelatase
MTGRQPEETPARIAPLPNLPLFHKLAGRKAVVAGACEGASWKAELLAAAGARVSRLADGWNAGDLKDAAIAVGDFGDRGEASRFVEAAHRAGALANIVDHADLSDVQFGTIVNRAPLVIGISTDGSAPMLGQSIRARIESLVPLGLSEWTRVAKEWRSQLKQRVADPASRREFWRGFATAAWREPDRAPTEGDFDQLLNGGAQPSGRVTLVGAGPGDPELLTLKAVRALQSATVILYDDLVGGRILELARREARRITVGKSAGAASCRQEHINRQMVDLALGGEIVVRLKGGDPLIFGRAGEEIAECRAAGIEVAVIPGISAAQGAAASLLFSLTERRQARRVQFLTGHAADGKLPGDIDWQSVADPKTTTLLYMARGTLAEFVRQALASGLDRNSPAVAIASATLPEEEHVACAIAGLPSLAGTLPARAPVLVVIGWVVRELAGSSAAILPFGRTAR